MASPDEREKALKAKCPKDQREFLRKLDRTTSWYVSNRLSRSWNPEENLERTVDAVLVLAANEDNIGNLVDRMLGLVTDRERQLQAAEDTARAAEDAAGGTKASAETAGSSFKWTRISAVAAIASLLLAGFVLALRCRSCQPPQTPTLDNPIVTTLPAAQHAP